MSKIKIGTGLPPPRGEVTVADGARFIKEVGLESAWVPDLLIGDGTPGLEPALILASAAAVTGRIGIGFSVLSVPVRSPAWLATQVLTLQHLSADRLLLGVGSVGFPDSPFWQAVGAPGRGRGRRTDTTLGLLPRLVSGEPTRLAHEQPPLALAPSAPMPPVLVGGNSEAARRRAVQYASGWFPSLITPADLAVEVARLRELSAEHGVPAPSVTVGGHLFLGDDSSARSAREAFVRGLVDVHRMPPEKAAEVAMSARNPEELAEVFAAYREAGADRIVTGPDNGDWRNGLRSMAEAGELLSGE